MKKVLGLTVCFLFLGVAPIFTEPIPGHSGELGAELSYIKYDEPGIMEEDGMMYGLSGAYTYRNNFMLKAEGKISYGQVDYENSGTMDDIDDYMLEFRGLGGWDFPIFTATTLTPYIGFGYRYLNDDMGGKYTSTSAFGYERESNYFYSPLGIETFTDLNDGWAFGFRIEYDYFWKGTQKSNMGWQPGYYDIENDQEKGYGLRGFVKVQKRDAKLDYLIEPFVRYWNIEESEITTDSGGTSWIEPKNNSTEIGIKFAVNF